MLSAIRTEKCLYHMNHKLVSFCKCSSCYLPVCQVCIRIHKNQHKMYETQPIFQNIDQVIVNVHQQTKGQLQKMQDFKQKVNYIPQLVQLGSENLKKKFIKEREKLIDMFERLMLSLQKNLIESIKGQENSFIFETESLQRQVNLVLSQIKQKVQSLEDVKSETRMDTVIKFYSEDQKRNFQQHFARLESRRMNLFEKKVEIDFDAIKDLENILRQKLHQFEEGTYVKDKYDSWVQKQLSKRFLYSTH